MAAEGTYKLITSRGWVISHYVGSEIHARLPATLADQLTSDYAFDSIKVTVHDDASLLETDYNKETMAKTRRVTDAFMHAACMGMAEGELCYLMSKVVVGDV